MNRISSELIKELDKSRVYDSVLSFPKQIEHTAEMAKDFRLPDNYRNVKNVVVAGMGGSALGARVVDSLYANSLPVPLEIVNDYRLPGYVNGESLVVASSYSGSTEEVLACYQEAKQRMAKTVITASGGKLASLTEADSLPGFVYQAVHNPSNQPRLAIGYAISALMVIFARAGLIRIEEKDFRAVIKAANDVNSICRVEADGNPAENLAQKLGGKIPILIGSEHLTGSVHVTNNQINENAKTFSADFVIPELNHHLTEGLKFPASNPQNLYFVFYESNLYHPRTVKRHLLTQKLIAEHQIGFSDYRPVTETRLEQAFEVIQFGNFYSFYLAILNGLDPAPVPTVDWFKKEMEKA